MKIDNDVKLDFDDVLLVPQRSKAASRKQVRLTRNFKFYHSPRMWEGIPIMAANMDTTGTFAMSDALQKLEWIKLSPVHVENGEVPLYVEIMVEERDKIMELADMAGQLSDKIRDTSTTGNTSYGDLQQMIVLLGRNVDMMMKELTGKSIKLAL